MKSILGISAFYHDSAAAIIINGEVIAAAQEERFTRKKQDSSFPKNAIEYVLKETGYRIDDIDTIAFYEKPFLKFERLLETYHAFAPRGLNSFLSAIPIWIKEKLFMQKLLRDELKSLGAEKKVKILYLEHHMSHAASAFYPSPFKSAAILTIDGVGEWATTTIAYGQNNSISILREMSFPHSLGLLYSSFTYYCGFKVNSGEYKLMGLAPYGNVNADETKKWKKLILDELVDLREDGSMILNMDYFNFATGLTMCRNKKWESLFGIPKREKESELSQPYMNLAMAIQQVTEDIVIRLGATARQLTGSENLVMAGGVALNCVANGKLVKSGLFKNLWIQPSAGDAGGALGAGLAAWYNNKNLRVVKGGDFMKGGYLGPEFSSADILPVIRRHEAPHKHFDDFDDLSEKVGGILAKGDVVGWFQGRMEFGPRALGNRSILGDPRRPDMQKKLNLKIKYREGFRPFAPAVLEEDMKIFFDLDCPSPYMLLVAPVKEERRKPVPKGYEELEMYNRLYHLRSDIPSITHIDYSARIQSVSKKTNERFWKLINAFKQKSGIGVVVNTSFNVRGEPIVCSPSDAYRCFMNTEMDWLVMGDFLFEKRLQPPPSEGDYKSEYELD
ncbi:MAG: hypothetical protein COB67_04210 [SAR324 cluster bacterium]|uniref:Carbamoyltransferase n=1 Tax=SAR324 cluster bacterium TaxID=2024889 RepID=A0A2A4T731_9DELT|nr:MAG: hypothetical protein COB67_04210 [SAR324 cluster bacterium]